MGASCEAAYGPDGDPGADGIKLPLELRSYIGGD